MDGEQWDFGSGQNRVFRSKHISPKNVSDICSGHAVPLFFRAIINSANRFESADPAVRYEDVVLQKTGNIPNGKLTYVQFKGPPSSAR